MVSLTVVKDVASEVLWMMTFPSSTVRVAKAWPPSPPCVEVTFPVRLSLSPTVVPATLTLNVHDPAAGNVAPDRLMVFDPCVADIVPPPHEPLRPFGASTTKPAGSASEKPIPVSVTVFGLVMVKLRLVVPPRGIAEAPKALLIAGGPIAVQVALPDPWTAVLSALWPIACTVSDRTPGIGSGM